MALSFVGGDGTTASIQIQGVDVIKFQGTTSTTIVKTAAFLTPPIGGFYTRMPGDLAPGTAYPGTTWTKVSAAGNLNGTFPRFEGQYSGHEACVYNTVYTSQNKSHNHSVTLDNSNPAHSHGIAQIWTSYYASNSYGDFWCRTNGVKQVNGNKWIDNQSNDHLHTLSLDNNGGTEFRPVCVGVECYRRDA